MSYTKYKYWLEHLPPDRGLPSAGFLKGFVFPDNFDLGESASMVFGKAQLEAKDSAIARLSFLSHSVVGRKLSVIVPESLYSSNKP